MKKLIVFSAVMVLAAGMATAASITVPFFLDSAPNLTSAVPESGSAGFIGINNNQGVDMDVMISYTTFPNGGAEPPETEVTSTFILGPNVQVSWRPTAADAGEGLGHTLVPNVGNGAEYGSVKITFVRSANPGDTTLSDIQGRYVQLNSTGSSFSFLLPAGFN